MTYKVEKYDPKTGKFQNCGIYTEEDVKIITRGYRFNGLFYERKGTMIFYIVSAEL